MKKRNFNVIDDLMNKDTDHDKLILNMACIFFDFGKELFGIDYFNILKEYLIDNMKTVDEIVLNCSISHSGYYRKIKNIFLMLKRLDFFIREAFKELKIDNEYINKLLNE